MNPATGVLSPKVWKWGCTLERFTPPPVGHLRIKESVEGLQPDRNEAFAHAEVVDRTSEFAQCSLSTRE